GVARLNANVDDGNCACLDSSNCLLKGGYEFGGVGHRAESLRTLCARHASKIDIGFRDALTDPAVFNRSIPHTGNTLLVQFVIKEGAIVGNHDQQWNAVMRRGPKSGHAHQEIAVTAHSYRKAAAPLECQRGADRNARTAANAPAAFGSKIVERVV